MPSEIVSIDWRRLAEPQSDGYDTDITLHLAMTTTSEIRRQPYQRRPVGDGPTIFDSAVAVRHVTTECPYDYPIINGPLDHPNMGRAESLVRHWPVVYRQFQRLVDSFHPLWEASVPIEGDHAPLLSCSEASEAHFGSIMATVLNPLMLAEAFVHEMAHQKLHALGVSLESARRLVRNPADRLYKSPVIRDRLRPMTAVLHAEYSFLYITELNIKIYEEETAPASRDAVVQLLAGNLPRIEEGLEELVDHLETDAEGAAFFEGLGSWVERVIRRGREILATERVAPHLLPAIRLQDPRRTTTRRGNTASVLRASDIGVRGRCADPRDARNPVVLFSNGFGDFILAWPTMRALAALFPGRLTLVSRLDVAEIFYSDVTFRDRVHVEMRPTADGSGLAFDAESVADAIAECDLFVSLNPWHSADVDRLIALLQPAYTAGFFPTFDIRCGLDYSKHSADLTFDPVRAIRPSWEPELFGGAARFLRPADPGLQRLLDSLTGGNLLLVHTETIPERTWSLSKMASVLDRFLREHPHYRVAVVGSLPRWLSDTHAGRVFDCKNLGVAGVGWLTEQTDVFLGVDSWVLHMTDLAGVPSVGIFGPDRAHEWGFRFGPHRVIVGDPRIDDVSPNCVYKALIALLSGDFISLTQTR
jgi:ADP-heptose:LPS heptosyltransferase